MLPIPKTAIEDFATAIPGEKKELVLTYVPDTRLTSSEIIPEEWLMSLMEW